ncbi:MAG: hypothetical protein IPI00_08165 [Flavobacteriales bacterium]|nr:hypothetical protein [Flavobacteriales bacterium]MBK6943932.1 hypothetical protein [Flavobacteriales bacterium]MBK7240140.1 hypothetical protein [Flavobacteriales bacterium]MBK9533603.1 hypothetical protein [Flavobacteriales bacterium]HQV51642.1 hypothetical protein [Flavobacteriales bacterium]
MMVSSTCLPLALFFFSHAHAQDPDSTASAIPELNQRIVTFVLGHEGKKVGRGECWDLAAEALNSGGATWDGSYVFGDIVDWRKEEILPGDIVQFANVEVEFRSRNMITRERYMKHTAVVVAVAGKGLFTIAHQNVEPVGKKVAMSKLYMADVRGGKLTFYRPHE